VISTEKLNSAFSLAWMLCLLKTEMHVDGLAGFKQWRRKLFSKGSYLQLLPLALLLGQLISMLTFFLFLNLHKNNTKWLFASLKQFLIATVSTVKLFIKCSSLIFLIFCFLDIDKTARSKSRRIIQGQSC